MPQDQQGPGRNEPAHCVLADQTAGHSQTQSLQGRLVVESLLPTQKQKKHPMTRPYSYRIATSGSTWHARIAGMLTATVATTSISAAQPIMIDGPANEIPLKSFPSRRSVPSAAPIPKTIPAPANVIVSRATIHNTD